MMEFVFFCINNSANPLSDLTLISRNGCGLLRSCIFAGGGDIDVGSFFEVYNAGDCWTEVDSSSRIALASTHPSELRACDSRTKKNHGNNAGSCQNF